MNTIFLKKLKNLKKEVEYIYYVRRKKRPPSAFLQNARKTQIVLRPYGLLQKIQQLVHRSNDNELTKCMQILKAIIPSFTYKISDNTKKHISYVYHN